MKKFKNYWNCLKSTVEDSDGYIHNPRILKNYHTSEGWTVLRRWNLEGTFPFKKMNLGLNDSEIEINDRKYLGPIVHSKNE